MCEREEKTQNKQRVRRKGKHKHAFVNIDLRLRDMIKIILRDGSLHRNYCKVCLEFTSTHSGFEIKTYGVDSIQQREIP